MDAIVRALVFAGLIVLVTILVLLLRHIARLRSEVRSLRESDETPAIVMLQGQVESLRDQVQRSLDGGRAELDRRLAETNRVVGEVRQGLGQVDRQVRSVRDATRDLRSLQELLRSPKLRGGLGEHLLTEVLSQVLPSANFDLQYAFPGGDRVDAIVRLGDGLVPIDAKFPLENFQRLRECEAKSESTAGARRTFRQDVRRHVEAIAQRYIRPGDGTFDFAMMYVPAEAVYQEIIHVADGDFDLLRYAMERRVVPVSPQSFYAYLQVIVLGLRGMTVEKEAREILGRVGALQTRLDNFSQAFELAAKHLGNAQRQMDEATRRLGGVDSAVEALGAATSQSETSDHEVVR